jgi:hypothetical protein
MLTEDCYENHKKNINDNSVFVIVCSAMFPLAYALSVADSEATFFIESKK